VQWNGTTVPTNYVSPTQLTATIPAADVYSAGPGGTPLNVNVTVFTVGPGGGTTAPVIFTITP
jgi:trimeric autotransporter adhesin